VLWFSFIITRHNARLALCFEHVSKGSILCSVGWFGALCITVSVSIGLWCIHIVMFDRIEQMVITLHGLMSTKPATGTAVSALETDNGQSRKQRVGTASQVQKIVNHVATEQENVGQLRKEEESQEMCL
jgi:hypothetical protein